MSMGGSLKITPKTRKTLRKCFCNSAEVSLFYFLCVTCLFTEAVIRAFPPFRFIQWPLLQWKLSPVDMAQQAVFVHSCCTSVWNPFLSEYGSKEGNLSNAHVDHLCYLQAVIKMVSCLFTSWYVKIWTLKVISCSPEPHSGPFYTIRKANMRAMNIY